MEKNERLNHLCVYRGDKLESVEAGVTTQLHHLVVGAHHLPLHLPHLTMDDIKNLSYVPNFTSLQTLQGRVSGSGVLPK